MDGRRLEPGVVERPVDRGEPFGAVRTVNVRGRALLVEHVVGHPPGMADQHERQHGGVLSGHRQRREVLGGRSQPAPGDVGPGGHRAVLAGVHPGAERAERPVVAIAAVPLPPGVPLR